MKSLTLTTSLLLSFSFTAGAQAQQARPQPVAVPQQAGKIADNKALGRLKCHLGTADQRSCAKVGYDYQPWLPRS